uniref:Uncharacterized protein n=1 Tax=Oryza sativa subsp. japonica TaxID=39947 RepID=Q6EQC2_ORYSJ|nr:hypothetical protein [Oryza sativa Japonica Group]BAD29148.1 hypothetical protein [Oryza sativa Japonica Group]
MARGGMTSAVKLVDGCRAVRGGGARAADVGWRRRYEKEERRSERREQASERRSAAIRDERRSVDRWMQWEDPSSNLSL